MHVRPRSLVVALALCACSGKSTAQAPSKGAEETKQQPTTNAAVEEAKAGAVAETVEAKAAVEEAKAGAVEPPYPSVDEELAASVRTKLGSLGPDPDERSKAAAVGLKQLERGRLPKELLDALDAMDLGTPVARDLRILKGLSGRPGRQAFSAICKGGNKVLDAVPAMAPAVQIPQLWRWCKLEENGLLDREEALAARSAMRLALAVTIHGYIEARTDVHPVERQALRTLATGK